jgi:glycosyltransferase involved in cell wall biosynthesis
MREHNVGVRSPSSDSSAMNCAIKVSVIIPVFNGAATIAATLESVFAQRFDGRVEVIVVNDGSTDETRAVLQRFCGRIAVIDQNNRGVAAARNAGIRAAAGEYVAPLDADDTWTDQVLAKTVPLLDENPSCAAVFGDAMLVDGAGEMIAPHYVDPGCDHSPTLDEMLARPWPILNGAIVFRREALLETGGFPEEFTASDYGGEDAFAFLLIRERGEIVFVPETLLRYRRTDFVGRITKRAGMRPLDLKSRREISDPERFFAGHRVLARLLYARYGARGRKLAHDSIDRTARELVSLGMVAMHQGDRDFARRCYLCSIRYRPAELKTYFRLAWAALPATVARSLSPMLSPRILRGLAGPPWLEERAQ